jgi:serine/threonine-protein kinase RsbW
MRSPELADWLGPTFAGAVELRVPADVQQLTLIRSVAQSVARQEGFGPDETTDITVAVDEACASLIHASVPGALLTCRYLRARGVLRVAVCTTTTAGQVPSAHAFGWRVLGTVTDSLSAWRSEFDPQRTVDRVVHIDFAKQLMPRGAR